MVQTELEKLRVEQRATKVSITSSLNAQMDILRHRCQSGHRAKSLAPPMLPMFGSPQDSDDRHHMRSNGPSHQSPPSSSIDVSGDPGFSLGGDSSSLGENDKTCSDSLDLEKSSTFRTEVQRLSTEMLPNWPSHLQRREVYQAAQSLAAVRRTRVSEMERKISKQLMDAADPHLKTLHVNGGELLTEFRFPSFVLHPNSNTRTVLDLFGIFVLAYDMMATPLTLAWDLEVSGSLLVMSWVTTIWWTLDIAFNFRTGFFADGLLEMGSKMVARRYMRTTFPVDIAVTFLDWLGVVTVFIYQSASQNDMTTLITTFPRIIKVTKLLRLMSFLRIARFIEPLERLGDQYFSQVLHHIINMVALLLLILWLNHILACAWYTLATSGATDTGYVWTNRQIMSDGPTYGECLPMFQYFTAMHWSLTQMTPGSMSVTPLNSLERLFNVVCLLLGLAFFGSVISSMTATLTQLKLLRQEREKTITALDKFLRRKAVGREIAVSVRKQVTQRMSVKKPPEMNDVKAITMLSSSLKAELIFELSKPFLRHHQLFRLVEQTSSIVLKSVCDNGVEFKSLLAQDVLFKQDDPSESAYFIMSGAMEYKQRLVGATGSQDSDLDNTFEVSEEHWLCWVTVWSIWKHVGTAEVHRATAAEVLILRPDALFKAISRNCDLRDIFEEYSLAFHKRLISAKPPDAAYPDDLQVPFTDYGEIILAMGPREQKLIGTMALERIEAKSWGWQGISVQAIKDLQKEVFSGICVLVENAEGGAERVVSFTGVRLQRADTRILLVLAKKRYDGCLEPVGQLPGVKQMPAELPGEAVRRILGQQLRPFAKAAQLGGSRREDISEMSSHYKITSMYIRLIYSATLPLDFEQPELPKPSASWVRCPAGPGEGRPSARASLSRHDRSSSINSFLDATARPRSKNTSTQWYLPCFDECVVLDDGKSLLVCSWMPAEVVELFRVKKEEGECQLKMWMANMHVE